MAMRFETGSLGDSAAARKWIGLSRWRLPLELVAVVFLLVALVQSVAAGS